MSLYRKEVWHLYMYMCACMILCVHMVVRAVNERCGYKVRVFTLAKLAGQVNLGIKTH